MQQRAFCEEYVIDFNGTRAAKAAGYAPGSAHVTATRLLKRDKIQGYVRFLTSEASRKTGITKQMVLEELGRLAFSDIGELVEWNETTVRLKDSSTVPIDARLAVASVSQTVSKLGVSRKIKLHDKLGALDKLAKHLGLYAEDVDSAEERARAIRASLRELEAATSGGS